MREEDARTTERMKTEEFRLASRRQKEAPVDDVLSPGPSGCYRRYQIRASGMRDARSMHERRHLGQEVDRGEAISAHTRGPGGNIAEGEESADAQSNAQGANETKSQGELARDWSIANSDIAKVPFPPRDWSFQLVKCVYRRRFRDCPDTCVIGAEARNMKSDGLSRPTGRAPSCHGSTK